MNSPQEQERKCNYCAEGRHLECNGIYVTGYSAGAVGIPCQCLCMRPERFQKAWLRNRAESVSR